MNWKPFTIKKILRIALICLAIHIFVSLVFILYPTIPYANSITKIYKRYLLPGPFFTESRIDRSNLLYLAWKVNGRWSTPINPSYVHYSNFFSELNPSLHYRSSLERDVYEKALLKLDSISTGSTEAREIRALKSFYVDRYVPADSDSVKIIFVRHTTRNFQNEIDTLHTIVF